MGTSQKKKLQALSSRFRYQETGLYRHLSTIIALRALVLKKQANGQY